MHCRAAIYPEVSVRHSKTERIKHLIFGKGLKIAVTYIDILRIDIRGLTSEIFCGRIIGNITCNGVGQLTTGIHSAGQYIRNTVPALLSALPGIQNSRRVIFLHPFHINDISHIQNYNDPFKCTAHLVQHILFQICQKITALLGRCIPVLPGCTPDHNNGRVGFGCSLPYQLFIQRHFLLTPRLLCPAASLVKRMFCDPGTVNFRQFFVYSQFLLLLQGVIYADHIFCVYKAS